MVKSSRLKLTINEKNKIMSKSHDYNFKCLQSRVNMIKRLREKMIGHDLNDLKIRMEAYDWRWT